MLKASLILLSFLLNLAPSYASHVITSCYEDDNDNIKNKAKAALYSLYNTKLIINSEYNEDGRRNIEQVYVCDISNKDTQSIDYKCTPCPDNFCDPIAINSNNTISVKKDLRDLQISMTDLNSNEIFLQLECTEYGF